MDLSLIYRALADRQVDLIAGDATSGLIRAYDLIDAAGRPSLLSSVRCGRRRQTRRRCSRIRNCARRLARLSAASRVDAMRAMNYAVDVEKRDPADVAREFLRRLERRASPTLARA